MRRNRESATPNNKRRAEVPKQKKCGVEFPEHKNVTAVMERNLAKLRENRTDSCLVCQIVQHRIPWHAVGANAQLHPSPWDWLRQPTPELTPHPPRTPPVPPCDSQGAHSPEIDIAPTRSVYIHTHLRSDQFVNPDAYAEDRKRDKDCNPDLLTDEGTSTG